MRGTLNVRGLAPAADRDNTDLMATVPGTNSKSGRRVLQVELVDRYPWWTWLALLSAAMIALLSVAGLPPVDLHGPLHYLGIMDPLCGGTRSVYLTMHGDLAAAIRYNPAAPLVPLATLAVLARAAVGRLFGRWITPTPPRGVVFFCFAAIALIVLEVNQQLNADLLTSGWPV